jgi:hypothetical protein
MAIPSFRAKGRGRPLAQGNGGVIGFPAGRLKGGQRQGRVHDAADFLGAWQITRAITDRRGGPPGHFAGTARFTPAPGGLRYAEEGCLTLGTTQMRATREHLWLFGPAGVEVRFADGRPFHAFRWDAAAAEHPCGADLYRVRYDFSAWPVWSATWDVTGPRKDYAMRSLWQRG